jgi:hypothetical protein
MQVLDCEAVGDLADLYRSRDRLRHSSRTPDLDHGDRGRQLAVTERHIARIEQTLTPAEVEEARRG